jgi:DnaJ family protein C protein 2
VEVIQGKIDADETAELADKLRDLKVAGDIKKVWVEEAKRLVGAGKVKEGDVKAFA